VAVGQVHVEQDEVDVATGEHLERASRRTSDSHTREARQAIDVGSMGFRGDGIVLDDEDA
jgi:hypothetical protein